MFYLRNFFQGWDNWLTDNPEAAKMAQARAEHCQDCVFSVKGMVSEWFGDKLKEIEGYKCDICNCPLSGLLRAPGSSCEHPDGAKWKAVSTEDC